MNQERTKKFNHKSKNLFSSIDDNFKIYCNQNEFNNKDINDSYNLYSKGGKKKDNKSFQNDFDSISRKSEIEDFDDSEEDQNLTSNDDLKVNDVYIVKTLKKNNKKKNKKTNNCKQVISENNSNLNSNDNNSSYVSDDSNSVEVCSSNSKKSDSLNSSIHETFEEEKILKNLKINQNDSPEEIKFKLEKLNEYKEKKNKKNKEKESNDKYDDESTKSKHHDISKINDKGIKLKDDKISKIKNKLIDKIQQENKTNAKKNEKKNNNDIKRNEKIIEKNNGKNIKEDKTKGKRNKSVISEESQISKNVESKLKKFSKKEKTKNSRKEKNPNISEHKLIRENSINKKEKNSQRDNKKRKKEILLDSKRRVTYDLNNLSPDEIEDEKNILNRSNLSYNKSSKSISNDKQLNPKTKSINSRIKFKKNNKINIKKKKFEDSLNENFFQIKKKKKEPEIIIDDGSPVSKLKLLKKQILDRKKEMNQNKYKSRKGKNESLDDEINKYRHISDLNIDIQKININKIFTSIKLLSNDNNETTSNNSKNKTNPLYLSPVASQIKKTTNIREEIYNVFKKIKIIKQENAKDNENNKINIPKLSINKILDVKENIIIDDLNDEKLQIKVPKFNSNRLKLEKIKQNYINIFKEQKSNLENSRNPQISIIINQNDSKERDLDENSNKQGEESKYFYNDMYDKENTNKEFKQNKNLENKSDKNIEKKENMSQNISNFELDKLSNKEKSKEKGKYIDKDNKNNINNKNSLYNSNLSVKNKIENDDEKLSRETKEKLKIADEFKKKNFQNLIKQNMKKNLGI